MKSTSAMIQLRQFLFLLFVVVGSVTANSQQTAISFSPSNP